MFFVHLIPEICIMRILVIILSMTMFLKPVFPVIEYIVNYDYIVNELCENKQIPELNCNGKCHLIKELAKASASESTNPTDKKVNVKMYEVVYFQELQSINFDFSSFFNPSKILVTWFNNYHYLVNTVIFHPPIK